MLGSKLLKGINVELTALTKTDTAIMALWHQDAEFMRFQDTAPAYSISEEQVLEWLDKNLKL